MKRKLVMKLVVAFLCTFSFSLFWSGMFFVAALLSGSAYFLVGIPSSLLIEWINERYLVNLLATVRIFSVVVMYAIAGMVASYFLMFVISGGEVVIEKNLLVEGMYFFVIGAIAALWFYLVSSIVSVLTESFSGNKDDQVRL